jgi:hypothetical protein
VIPRVESVSVAGRMATGSGAFSDAAISEKESLMSQAPELVSLAPTFNIPMGLSVIAAHKHLILGLEIRCNQHGRSQAVTDGRAARFLGK